MKPDQAFAAEHAKFKEADAKIAKLSAQLEQARLQRKQAAANVVSADNAVNHLVTSTNLDATAAADVAQKKYAADAALALIDRAVVALETDVAGAKFDVVLAERACAATQAQHYDAALDDAVGKWLGDNRKSLQQLCQGLHRAFIFAQVRTDGPQDQFPAAHVETLFTSILPRLVSNTFANDEDFRNNCQAVLTGAAIGKIVASTNVNDGERMSISAAGNRNAQIATLQQRAVREESVDPTFNPYNVELNLRQLRQRIDAMRKNVANIEQRIKDTNSSRQPKSLGLQLSIEQDKNKLKAAQAELADVESKATELEQQLLRHAA